MQKLTDKPVLAIATHIHWDHIGGHKYFPNFYVHAEEVHWLNGEFPQSLEAIKGYVTDPKAYLNSLEKVAELPAEKVFPAHHTLDIQPEILIRMRDAFRMLSANGKLHHGSGKFDYGDWALWL